MEWSPPLRYMGFLGSQLNLGGVQGGLRALDGCGSSILLPCAAPGIFCSQPLRRCPPPSGLAALLLFSYTAELGVGEALRAQST